MKTTTIFGFYSPPSSSKLSFLSSLVSSVSTRKCLPALPQLKRSFAFNYSEELIEGCPNNKEMWFFEEKKGAHSFKTNIISADCNEIDFERGGFV